MALSVDARRLLASWQFALCLLLAAAAGAIWFWFHPSLGGAIAVLGAMAALMSIREIGPREKFAWSIMVFALLGVELHAIRHSDEELAESRKKENEAFQAIATGITKSISNSDKSFALTMGRMNTIVELSSENIKNVTGGDSFCYLHSFTQEGAKQIP